MTEKQAEARGKTPEREEPLRLGHNLVLARGSNGETYVLSSDYDTLKADLETTQAEFEKRGELWAQDRERLQRAERLLGEHRQFCGSPYYSTALTDFLRSKPKA